MDHESAKKTPDPSPASIARTNDSAIFYDINVPEWRFQMQGVDAVNDWMKAELPNGSRVPSWRSDPTAEGVLVEIEQRYDSDGVEISSRNLHRLEVRDGKVTEWTMYCTGEWSPELRERQAQEAPMFRP